MKRPNIHEYPLEAREYIQYLEKKVERLKENVSDSLPCGRLSLPDSKEIDSHDVDAFLDGVQWLLNKLKDNK